MEFFETLAYEISDQLKRELTGHDMGDLRHYANIERYYPVGCIFPEPPDETPISRPTSCGFSIRVIASKKTSLEILLRGHIYIRRRPTLNEQKEHLARQWNIPLADVDSRLKENTRVSLPYCWRYVPFEEKIMVVEGQSKVVVSCSKTIGELWAREEKLFSPIPCNKNNKNMGLTEAYSKPWTDQDDYDAWLDSNFPHHPPTPSESETHLFQIESAWENGHLEIYAINRSKADFEKDRSFLLLDQNFYAVEFELKIPKDVEIEPTINEVTDSFEASAHVTTWGEGRNLQLRVDGNVLYVEPIGLITSNRSKPLGTTGETDLSFKTLSRDPLASVSKVTDYLEQKINDYKQLASEIKTNQAYSSVSKLESILDRYKLGEELLRTNPKMLDAFKLMNETFRRRYICDSDVNSWRGFQFVYIVGKLPSIIDPQEEVFDVIFVSTGGGKTETYFGFIITAMFYLRIINKNVGNVAIVKFPLRMLAIDQIQRIAPLIALADMIRSERIGDDKDGIRWLREFSLGFMIGGSSSRSTPNKVNDSGGKDEDGLPKEATDLHHLLDERPEEAKILFECPVCRYRNHHKGHKCNENLDTVEISYDDIEIRGKHQCTQCGTRFAVHWTDEECFRYLPTVIISTQDRISYGAFAAHTRGLFGAPLYMCPRHGFSIYSNTCTPYKEKGGYGRKGGSCPILKHKGTLDPVAIDGKDRAVRYIIQDEMHLLRSDLGALDSPFEKMVAHTIFHYCKSKPQYIGMSATVQGVQRQVKELYGAQKEVWLFPGDPPIDHAAKKVDAFFEHTDDLHRLFLGCMPSMGDPSVVVQRVLDITTKMVERWEYLNLNDRATLPSALNSISADHLGSALRQYRVNLGFMNAKVDLERTMQNLVNITNVERAKIARVHGASSSELIVEELTGDNTVKDIRRVIDKVKRMATKMPDDRLDILLATNLVSHGIDLKEMNIMVFYAIPGATSEYIQALSRVGRTFPGIIVIVYHPKRARDRGLWRTFNPYHEALRQQVEIMPVDHFAPGLEEQSFVTLLRCYWNLIAEPIIFDDTRGLYKVSDIVSVAASPHKRILVDEACNEIVKWYEWEPKKIRDFRGRADDYLRALTQYHDTLNRGPYTERNRTSRPLPMHKEMCKVIGSNADRWMATMTGIRGIQEGLSEHFDKFTEAYLRKEMSP
jgi:hypothetical protein